MLDKRGSALVNVIAVVFMLLILGFGLMQFVNADGILATRDADVTHSLQMAEGGLDYGLEMLHTGAEQILGTGCQWPLVGEPAPSQPFVIEVDEGRVEVTIEAIEHDKKYLITSKSFRKSASRTLQAWVSQYISDNPFPYSLYVGGIGSDSEPEPLPTDPITGDPLEPTEYDLVLSNVKIMGSVYIAAQTVHVASNTYFNKDVHFASDYVKIDSNTYFDIYRGEATCEPNTYIKSESNKDTHWSKSIGRVSKNHNMPDIPLASYAYEPEFYNWGSVSSIDFAQLGWHMYNFFEGDVTILLDKDNHPNAAKMVIASTGSVNFANKDGSSSEYQPAQDTILVVMAEQNITGVEKLSNKGNGPKLNLYLYAKGDIEAAQNVIMSSVMAQLVTFASQNQEIQAPDPRVFDDLPGIIKEHWGIKGFAIIKWMN